MFGLSGDEERRLRAYETALTLVGQDSQNLWSIFASFFVPQAVVVGLAVSASASTMLGPVSAAYAAGLFGLLLLRPHADHARALPSTVPTQA